MTAICDRGLSQFDQQRARPLDHGRPPKASTGHHVRTTVRSLTREGDVRAMLKTGGAEPGDRLSFFAADLMRDDPWPEAVAGCDYVLHVASPFPMGVPKHPLPATVFRHRRCPRRRRPAHPRDDRSTRWR